MNVDWWRISKKFMDCVQIKISLPAFYSGMPEYNLGDVFLPYKFGNGFRHSLRFKFDHLRPHTFGKPYICGQCTLIGVIVVHPDVNVNHI